MENKNPYEKDIISKCQVCNFVLLINQYGHGKCENCSWEQIGSDLEKYKVGYPNMVPLSKARQLYENGKSFIPTFEEFVQALMFYGEMEFFYLDKKFVVLRYTHNCLIEFCNDKDTDVQKYNSKAEFMAKANINGMLLKNIWDKVKDPYWLN